MTQALNLALLGNNVNTSGQVSLTAAVSGTLPVANGGTGATTLAANNVLLGNGTSAFQAVAPGTSGNVLTSNGSTWTSAAVPNTAPTDFGAVGTYAVLTNAANTNLAINATVAGSNLRYDSLTSFQLNTYAPTVFGNFTTNPYTSVSTFSNGEGGFNYYTNGFRIRTSNSSYDGGGTALAGTWRKVSSGTVYALNAAGPYVPARYQWANALYVRIS